MNKLMLIDAAHPEETRVALVADGRIDDFDFEAAGRRQLRGNIYLAKVTRVEPSLQAAFVEYGGNRHGFLAFGEIHPDYYQLPQADREALLQEEAERAASQADDDEDDEDSEDAADDETSEDDQEAPRRNRRSNGPSRRYKIQEVIRRNQVMLVQVVKEERGNKGAALTTYLSLAGRYCVLMPNTPRGGGISRKITAASDRSRLKKLVSELNVPQGMGLIVRTAGAKRTKTELKRDFDYLLKLWDSIRELTLKSIAPRLINEEGGLVHRAMRDLYDKDVGEVLVQGDAAYREAKDVAILLLPSHARKVKQWKDSRPLFVELGVEEQLDSIFSPVVRLKSGGYLVINQTEALVAIDVNSGKSTRERNIEQTALRTNLEAAEEACRQMRLRDLAGLVVIDFIDMDESKNDRAVEKKLKECLKLDRARVQQGRISQFGLMEISRQRRRAGVLDSSSAPCEACNGTGRRRSTDSAALQLLRAIEARLANGGLLSVTVAAPSEVALYILNNKRDTISALEAEAGLAISMQSAQDMLPGDFRIDAEKDPHAKPRPKRKAEILEEPDDDAPIEDELDEPEADAVEAEKAETEGSGRRRRRRGGRGRRRRDEADAPTGLEVVDQPVGEAEATGETSEDTQIEGGDEDADTSDESKPKRRRRGRRGGKRRRRGEDAAIDATDTEIEADAAPPEAEPEPLVDAPKLKPSAAPEDGGVVLDTFSISPAEILEAIRPEDVLAATSDPVATAPVADPEPVVETQVEPLEPVLEPTPEAEAAETPEEAPPTEPEFEPESPPEPAAVAEPEPEIQPTARPEPEPQSAETPAPAPAEQADKPKKRGWWQRRRAG